MQPTLFTAAYAADRAELATPSPRPATRARLGRKAATIATVAVAAIALAGGLATATATDAHSNPGVLQHDDFRSAIVSPGQFGWQAHCPHTGPAPR